VVPLRSWGAGLFALRRVSPGRGWLLALSLVPLAVAGNALRGAGLILLGGAGQPWLHTVLGVWCFGLVAMAVCLVGGAWRGEARRSG
jgi:exosortase/archaeosortase family protein